MVNHNGYTNQRSIIGASMKYVLSITGILLAIVFVVMPLLEKQTTEPETTLEKPEKVKDSETSTSINNLIYQGKTENSEFKIYAESLNKSGENTDSIILISPKGILKSSNGIQTEIVASTGVYNSKQKTLILKNNVTIVSSENTKLSSQHISIDVNSNNVTSYGRTHIQRDNLIMEGDGATITADSIFELKGNIKLVQAVQ